MPSYFVFVPGTPAQRAAGDRPYIQHEIAVAQAEADEIERTQTRGSIDGAERAGPNAWICTEEELVAHRDGRRALQAWRGGDHSALESSFARAMREADEEERRFAALSEKEKEAEVRTELGMTQREFEEWRAGRRRLAVVEGG